MKLTSSLLIAATLALSSIRPLPAQDPVDALVPANSSFVCYVDIGAALDLVGRDTVRKGIEQKGRAQSRGRLRGNWLDKLTRDWSFDPFTDLKGVLLFGDKGPHEGAALALITSARIDGVI